eukprot:6198239-Pleurochrysis_carterae.AAC.9
MVSSLPSLLDRDAPRARAVVQELFGLQPQQASAQLPLASSARCALMGNLGAPSAEFHRASTAGISVLAAMKVVTPCFVNQLRLHFLEQVSDRRRTGIETVMA